MNVLKRLQRLLSRPPREIISRVAFYANRRYEVTLLSIRDSFYTSFAPDNTLPTEPLQRLIPAISADEISHWQSPLLNQASRASRHQFELLGAGLLTVEIGLEAAGLEGYRYPSTPRRPINRSNRVQAQSLRCRLSPNYRPIDWHLDFRSGYRWPEDKFYTKIPYGDLPGVDIKLPWELARMQHLSCLALAYSQLLLLGDEAGAGKLKIEFQDQVLDFTTANPPRFGVNWVCTMDVAIRIVNWLVAYDLFCSFGAEFDDNFEREFKRAVVTHGHHIISNLEWFPHLRSNHYLSNIAGLFAVAAYLPESVESNAWLVLAANELAKEAFIQFHPDGSNFEASTSYHRLSAEMMLFSVALAHRIRPRLESIDFASVLSQLKCRGPGILPESKDVQAEHKLTDASVLELLEKMAKFTMAATKPDGSVVQIGDNDNGRFLKLSPDVSDDGRLKVNNHQALVAGIRMACTGDIACESIPIEAVIVRSLMADAFRLNDSPMAEKYEPAWAPSALAEFPDFGLYIYRRARLWLSVRCGSVGQNGNGGHAHNDQLSIALCLDGVPFIVDIGTYLYTPLPATRNIFRSTAAHATLVASPGEQNSWLEGRYGLFSMIRTAATKVIEVQPQRFVGEHDGFGMVHRREIAIADEGIYVTDSCYADGRFLVFPLVPGVNVHKLSSGLACQLKKDGVSAEFRVDEGEVEINEIYYSSGYGMKIKSWAIWVKSIAPVCRWEISLKESANG